MSMSACERCWCTPCSCGWDYRNDSKDYRTNLAAVVLGIPKDSDEYRRLSELTPDKHFALAFEAERAVGSHPAASVSYVVPSIPRPNKVPPK
jgi:hypothetical protein